MSNLLELLAKGLEQPLSGLILAETGAMSPAEAQELELVIAKEPENLHQRLQLGLYYSELGTPEQGHALFESCGPSGQGEKDDGSDREWALCRAILFTSHGDLEHAIELLEQTVELLEPSQAMGMDESGDPRLAFALGYCYERIGREKDALATYRTASDQPRALPQTRQRLAAILVHHEHYGQAIETMLTLQNEDPGNTWNYMVLGQLYLQINDYDRAIAMFERALTIEPDNFELQDEAVDGLVQSGQLYEAIQQVKQTLETQGEFPDTYVRLGDLYSRLGEDVDATRQYRKALTLHPGYLEAAVKLGTQHLRMHRYLEAAANFNKAVEINDQLIMAYVSLGMAERLEGGPGRGDDTIELAGALQPNSNLLFAETVRLQLKITLQYQQRTADMEFGTPPVPPTLENNFYADDNSELSSPGMDNDFDALLNRQISRHRSALEDHPNDAGILYRYALLLWCQGRVREAIRCLQRAVEINPAFAKAHIKLGLALRETGELETAYTHFRTALSLEPRAATMHYKLGLMYCDRFQFTLAMENCQLSFHALDQHGTLEANIMLALQNMGMVDPVEATWRAVCELEPHSPLAFQSQRTTLSQKAVH